MTQEGVTESAPLCSTFNETWNICDQNIVTINCSNPEIWREGSEGIVGNLWFGVAHDGEKSRLTGVWQTNETNVS